MEPWSWKVAVLVDVEYLDVHNLVLLQTPLWKADEKNVKEVSILDKIFIKKSPQVAIEEASMMSH